MSTQVFTSPSPVESIASHREKEAVRQLASFPARGATVASFVLADAAAMLVVGLLAASVLSISADGAPLVSAIPQVWMPLAGLLVLAFAVSGLYRVRSLHPAQEIRSVTILTAIVGGAFTSGLYLLTPVPDGVLLVTLTLVVLAVVAVPVVRGLFRVCCARLPWWGVPAVVISSEDAASGVLDTLKRWPELGITPVGLVQPGSEETVREVPVIGEDDQALFWARRQGITHAVLSRPDLAHRERAHLVGRYRRIFPHVSVIPAGADTPAFCPARICSEGLHGFDVTGGPRLAEQAVKRVMDVLVASVLLVLLAPLWGTIALLVKLDSEGLVLFRQERMGQDGQRFILYKFRTMYKDAEARLDGLLALDPELRAEYETFHKLQKDPRVTRVGGLLRSLSLDELPQLLNVVKGDMSLVGPRAYLPEEQIEMNGYHHAILERPPGITGLWQVGGRNELTFEERVTTDMHYAQHWSLWLDLYILVRTVPVVLSGEGAC